MWMSPLFAYLVSGTTGAVCRVGVPRSRVRLSTMPPREWLRADLLDPIQDLETMLIPRLSKSSMSSTPLSTIRFRGRSTDPKIEVAHSIPWTWALEVIPPPTIGWECLMINRTKSDHCVYLVHVEAPTPTRINGPLMEQIS